MSEKKLKDFMNEQAEKSKPKSDEEIFSDLELDESDLNALKTMTLTPEPTLSALINLVLRERAGRVIKEENKEELLLRNFINEKGNITIEGKTYIETEEVKNRLNKLL